MSKNETVVCFSGSRTVNAERLIYEKLKATDFNCSSAGILDCLTLFDRPLWLAVKNHISHGLYIIDNILWSFI